VLLALSLLAITWWLATMDMVPGPADWTPGPDLSIYPWIYLRDGAPVSGETPVSLIVVGDVMPGRGVSGERNPLGSAAPWLRGADLTLGNLEAVVAPEGPARATTPGEDGPYILSAPAAAAEWLAGAGFDLMGLANNHSLDYGVAGLTGTAGLLEAAGMTVLGAGSGDRTYRPLIREVRDVRLAFLAFNAVPDPAPGVQPAAAAWQIAAWDEARAVAAVAEARQQADAVVVSLHWGQEYALRAAPWQREAAQALVQAGADLVIGHHPHVVQEVDAPAGKRWSPIAWGISFLTRVAPIQGRGWPCARFSTTRG